MSEQPYMWRYNRWSLPYIMMTGGKQIEIAFLGHWAGERGMKNDGYSLAPIQIAEITDMQQTNLKRIYAWLFEEDGKFAGIRYMECVIDGQSKGEEKQHHIRHDHYGIFNKSPASEGSIWTEHKHEDKKWTSTTFYQRLGSYGDSVHGIWVVKDMVNRGYDLLEKILSASAVTTPDMAFSTEFYPNAMPLEKMPPEEREKLKNAVLNRLDIIPRKDLLSGKERKDTNIYSYSPDSDTFVINYVVKKT